VKGEMTMNIKRNDKAFFYQTSLVQLRAINVLLSAITSSAIHNLDTFDRELEELNQLERMLLDLKNKYQNRLNEE
jgi:hypothetical protein